MAASPRLAFDSIRQAMQSNTSADTAHTASAHSTVLGSQASVLILDSKKDTPEK